MRVVATEMASREATATAAAFGIRIGSRSEEMTYLQMVNSYVEEERRRYGEEETGKDKNLRD